MARIAGVDLPREKRVAVGLTYIFGIGHNRSASILKKAGSDWPPRTMRRASDFLVLDSLPQPIAASRASGNNSTTRQVRRMTSLLWRAQWNRAHQNQGEAELLRIARGIVGSRVTIRHGGGLFPLSGNDCQGISG